MINDCAQCEEYEQETKAMLAKCFSQDGLTVLAVSVGNAIRMQVQHVSKIPFHDLKRVMMQRDIDFAGAVLGTVLSGFDYEYKKKLLNMLKKLGLELRENERKCDHKKKEDAVNAETNSDSVAKPEAEGNVRQISGERKTVS